MEFTGVKPAVGKSADLTRILALPRRPAVEPGTPEAEALIAHVTAKYTLGVPSGECNCAGISADWGMIPKPCIVRLNYAQAWMLHEIRIYGGLVAAASVGIGKTLIDILGCLAMPNCKTAVLLVPPTLASQLAREYEFIAQHFEVPSIVIHHKVRKQKEWRRMVPGKPMLHVLPYSRLSRPESTVYLEQVLKPDFILADEAQNVSHLSSVRTGRLVRYFETYGDAIRMAAYSGSITDDSITNYSSLAALALKRLSPLPLDPHTAEVWGSALDPDPGGWLAPAGALRAFCKPGEELDEGFARLLGNSPGFIITSGASLDLPLIIKERPVRELPDVPRVDPAAPGMIGIVEPGVWPGVKTALKAVRENWVRPDGEILLEALQVGRCARELACGLFLKWKFIRKETRDQIDAWRLARKMWRSELREMLKAKRPHMDSPMLCALAAMRAHGHLPRRPGAAPVLVDLDEEGKQTFSDQVQTDGLPEWKAEFWCPWYNIRKTVTPITEAVRLDDFLAQDAAEWGTENKGIIWYKNPDFGKWVSEIGKFPFHGGGSKAGERLAKERGETSIVCSIKSHGTGRDGLQRLFATQLITQPFSSAVEAEQLFGRLSRIGQEADAVHAWCYRHTTETRKSFDSAVRKATYVSRTLKMEQKLLVGWDLEDAESFEAE